MSFIFDFEDSVIRYARERGVDGVICGHIHAATIKDIDGITYINCGDWVDSCTAIVEHHDGRKELIEWGSRSRPAQPQPVTHQESPTEPEPVLPDVARTATVMREAK